MSNFLNHLKKRLSPGRPLAPRRGFLPRWAFQVAAVLLLALIVKNVGDYRRAKTEGAGDGPPIPFEKLIEQATLLEDLELLSANVDFAELTEAEWKILLERIR